MKGLCTVSSGDVVSLLISGKEMPEVGAYYNLEHAVNGTSAQNKTFHALTLEYFKSGQSSYAADNYADFKKMIKRGLGEGFGSYVYVEMVESKIQRSGAYYSGYVPRFFEVKSLKDIPKHIKDDPEMDGMIRGKLKSWSNYTKKQRKQTIDNVINEMLQCGINTNKFQEILKGINYENV